MLVAHLSDPHLTSGVLGAEPAAGLVLAIGRAVALQPQPDVLLISGDLVERGTAEEYRALREVLAHSPLPVHLATGNHDRRVPLLAAFAGTAHLPGLDPVRDAGAGRIRYVVEGAAARVVVLDSLVEPRTEDSGVRGAGRLGRDQLRWLEESLDARPRTPTLLALHHPPIPVGIPFLDAMMLLDADDLREVLTRHGQVRGVLAGHVHRQVTGTLAGAVVSLAPSTFRQSALVMADDRAPGYLAEPTGFLLHSLDEDGYVVHTVAVSHAVCHQRHGRVHLGPCGLIPGVCCRSVQWPGVRPPHAAAVPGTPPARPRGSRGNPRARRASGTVTVPVRPHRRVRQRQHPQRQPQFVHGSLSPRPPPRPQRPDGPTPAVGRCCPPRRSRRSDQPFSQLPPSRHRALLQGPRRCSSGTASGQARRCRHGGDDMSAVLPPSAPPGPAGPRALPALPTRTRARRDASVRALAGAALWGSLLLVTSWWLTGRGMQDLTGWATGLTSLGRLSGLFASVLLMAQLVLMARIPLLENSFGRDRLTRIHRWIGFCSFDLMLAHIVTITWGYAAGELTRVPATAWDLVTDYPGMLLATAGTAALIAVVVTSIRAARRTLRYESWHLIHLYAYLGVGLALPHQLWTGTEFTASPGRTVFWWSAWGATVAAVLVWRIGLPLLRTRRHRLFVTRVVPEAPGVVSVHLSGRELPRLPVEAGQFLGFRFLDGTGWMRNHPYSLSAAPTPYGLRITVRTDGDGGRRLATVRPGTRVLVEGPYGRLTGRARTSPKVTLIGAGVGITPLRALAEALPYAPGDAVLLHRFRDQPLFPAEFAGLAAGRGLRVVDLPGPRRGDGSWLGRGTPPVDDVTALRWLVPDIAQHDVYVCGPRAWAQDVRTAALSAGVPAERLHLEEFGW